MLIARDTPSLGAPGCEVFVAPGLLYGAKVNANGEAAITLPIPVDPRLSGLEIFAQSASTSTVNGLGLAASDAVLLRFR